MITSDNRLLCDLCFCEKPSIAKKCPHCGEKSNSAKYPSALPEGKILAGKFAVGKVLGKGGFGITYLCYDLHNNKKMAVKEFLPESLTYRTAGTTNVMTNSAENAEQFQNCVEKFYNEAKLVAKFNGNPGVIAVHEFFYENNTAYFTMEYLQGCDLKEYIKKKGEKIPESEAAYILNSVLNALLIVHSTGILHRDIKPDNIYLCSDGNIKLIDFGAARQVVGEASKSLSVILTPGFAPLEQYQKKGHQGAWTDIYALGATIYYAVTGNVIDDAMSRLDEPELDMSRFSPQLAAILEKMLAVRTEGRYQNVIELKADLEKSDIPCSAPVFEPDIPDDNNDDNNDDNDDTIPTTTNITVAPSEPVPWYKKTVTKIAAASLAGVIAAAGIAVAVVQLTKEDERPALEESDEIVAPVKPSIPVTQTNDFANITFVKENAKEKAKNVANAKNTESGIVDSGWCGENVAWKLDSAGTLTIAGLGNMEYYLGSYTDTPWYLHIGKIKKVVIENGVTSIGHAAFYLCTELTEITIPDSVTRIGEYAFSGCTGLTEITIPDSVTSIGDWAFFVCTDLTEITIPDSVTSIGVDAFYGCTELTEITIPDSVTSIGNSAFENCTNLKDIYVEGYTSKPSGWDENWKYDCNAKVHWNYNSSGNTPTTTPTPTSNVIGTGKCGDNATWTLTDDGVLTISGSGEMDNYNATNNEKPAPWTTQAENIKKIIIEKGITNIGNDAFYHNTALEEVQIGNSVTSIGEFAFAGCTGLTESTIPDSVTRIGAYAFRDCTGLTNITIPDSVTRIENSTFNGCTGLTNITIPDSVTSIEDWVFDGCTGLTEITIPDSVTRIEAYAFRDCTELTEITIPNSVISINMSAFEGCTKLTEITIPNSVTRIEAYAFYGCTDLTEITIPDSVTSIGYGAFSNCTNLKDIYVEGYTSKPSGWDKNWKYNCNAKVHWNS